jgi:hypothetical protein
MSCTYWEACYDVVDEGVDSFELFEEKFEPHEEFLESGDTEEIGS